MWKNRFYKRVKLKFPKKKIEVFNIILHVKIEILNTRAINGCELNCIIILYNISIDK